MTRKVQDCNLDSAMHHVRVGLTLTKIERLTKLKNRVNRLRSKLASHPYISRPSIKLEQQLAKALEEIKTLE